MPPWEGHSAPPCLCQLTRMMGVSFGARGVCLEGRRVSDRGKQTTAALAPTAACAVAAEQEQTHRLATFHCSTIKATVAVVINGDSTVVPPKEEKDQKKAESPHGVESSCALHDPPLLSSAWPGLAWPSCRLQGCREAAWRLRKGLGCCGDVMLSTHSLSCLIRAALRATDPSLRTLPEWQLHVSVSKCNRSQASRASYVKRPMLLAAVTASRVERCELGCSLAECGVSHLAECGFSLMLHGEPAAFTPARRRSNSRGSPT